MTVELIKLPQRYQGLASDAKPTDTGVQNGATFYELDTGRTYIWDGLVWREQLTPNETTLSTGATSSTATTASATLGEHSETNRLLRRLIAGLELSLGNEFPDVE